MKVEKNLDIIAILHPPEIERVPGVIAFLLDSLASENINIVHFFSCYNDTLLVVKSVNTIKAFQILREVSG